MQYHHDHHRPNRAAGQHGLTTLTVPIGPRPCCDWCKCREALVQQLEANPHLAAVRKMKQNLFWAAIYTLIAIPIAAGALYPTFELMLRPSLERWRCRPRASHWSRTPYSCDEKSVHPPDPRSRVVHWPSERRFNSLSWRQCTVSGLVFLLLLGHLTLMASPLHSATFGLDELSSSLPGWSELQAELSSGRGVVVGPPHIGHHCVVEWSAPARLVLSLTSGASTWWPLLAPDLDLSSPALEGCGLGPHQQLDFQALLQVFRL